MEVKILKKSLLELCNVIITQRITLYAVKLKITFSNVCNQQLNVVII